MNQLPKFNSTIKCFNRSLFKYHFIYTRFTLCSVYSLVGTTCFMNRNNIFNSCWFVTIWLWLDPKPFSLSLHAFLDIAWILFLYDDVIKWKHFSALLALCVGNSPVTAEFPIQRPVTRSFYIFFDQRLNKQLRKQSWGRWFETPSRSFWRHCKVIVMLDVR